MVCPITRSSLTLSFRLLPIWVAAYKYHAFIGANRQHIVSYSSMPRCRMTEWYIYSIRHTWWHYFACCRWNVQKKRKAFSFKDWQYAGADERIARSLFSFTTRYRIARHQLSFVFHFTGQIYRMPFLWCRSIAWHHRFDLLHLKVLTVIMTSFIYFKVLTIRMTSIFYFKVQSISMVSSQSQYDGIMMFRILTYEGASWFLDRKVRLDTKNSIRSDVHADTLPWT